MENEYQIYTSFLDGVISEDEYLFRCMEVEYD